MNRFVSVVTHSCRPFSLLIGLAVLLFTGVGAVTPTAAQEQSEIRTADYNVSDLTFPDLRDFEAPEPERLTLGNGMIVFLLEDHELPQVNAVAQIGTGSVYESHKKRGLASITGTVMRTGGTASMSPDSLNVVLENLGATVETSIGQTSGSAYMSTLSDNVDTVLPVFAEVIRQPGFDESKVKQAKSRQKSSISRRNDNARQVASREFNKVLYGEDSPYARTPEYYTIDRITREDLVDFHEQYVHPNNVILSVWGDFDTETMKKTIREQFGGWSAAEDFERPMPPEPTATREHSVNFIQKEDVNQSTIFMGHPGEITRQSDDYAPVTIMNEVLSGFSGRLFQSVRKEQGLAYAVFGQYTAEYNRPGRFFAGVFSKSPTTVEATNAVMDEINRMRQEAPTQEELNLAKDSYLNSFVFNFDTEREILSRLMTYEYYDYPSDFLQQTKEAIETVTASDVQSVAKKYLYPDQSHILVVGNQQDFSQDLSSLSKDDSVRMIDISIPKEPPGQQQDTPTAAEKEAMAAGKKLMASAKETLGGSAFDQINSMRVVTKQQGSSSTLVVELPNKMRVERGGITITSDGSTVKMSRGGQTRTLPASMQGRITGQLWRSLPYLMANLDHQGLSFQAQEDTTIGGTPYKTVRVKPPAGSAYTLHLNAETMRPERLSLQQTNPRSGAMVRVTQTFSDFREVSGVMVPFATESVQSTSKGERTITSTIQELQINVDPEDALFTLGDSSSE